MTGREAERGFTAQGAILLCGAVSVGLVRADFAFVLFVSFVVPFRPSGLNGGPTSGGEHEDGDLENTLATRVARGAPGRMQLAGRCARDKARGSAGDSGAPAGGEVVNSPA
jgi:hypothetical protein